MLNYLFLIGNGFDRNLGLKTSFRDILDEYKLIHKNSTNKIIQDYLIELEQNKEEWAFFENRLGQYIQYFNKENKHILFEQIDSFQDVMINKLKHEENRIDISEKEGKIFSSIFQKSLVNFDKYLTEESRLALIKLLPTTSKDNTFYFDFISFNYTNTLDLLLNVIRSKSSNKPLRSYHNGTADQPYKDNIGKVLHIHGTLEKDFILGVDNKSQIANEILSNDDEIQCLIKPYQNQIIGENNEMKAKKLIDKSNIICVFGMSIGITDKTWWDYIFNWIILDENHHLIIFYYSDELDIRKPRTKDIHVKKVLNTFLSIIDNSANFDVELLKKRIHIPFGNQDMFNINLFNEPISTYRKVSFSDPLQLDRTIAVLTNPKINDIVNNAAKITETATKFKKLGII